jgi:hypothetical protein
MNVDKIPKLQGAQNYDLWSMRVESLLLDQQLNSHLSTAIITKTAVELNISEETYQEWVIGARRSAAMIRLTLGDGPLLQTKDLPHDPYLIWKQLQTLYSKNGFSSEFLSCKDLINTTLKSCKGNMEAYIHQIKRILNTLISANIRLPDRFVVALLLNNLSSEYDYISAMMIQTIRSTGICNLDLITSQLLDESRRQRGSTISSTPSSSYHKKDEDTEMTMTTQGHRQQQQQKNTKPKCNFCKKPNHKESDCWTKFPEKKPSTKKVNCTEKSETILVTKAVLSTSVCNTDWILDSGASVHICCNRELFTSISASSTSIAWGSYSSKIQASGVGTVSMFMKSTKKSVLLTNVLYVPELKVNLLSLGLIADKGVYFTFKNRVAALYLPSNEILVQGKLSNKLVIFDDITYPQKTSNPQNQTVLSTSIWHDRLAHIGPKALKALKENTEGITENSIDVDKDCRTCIEAKLTRNISREPQTSATRYLEKIHIDICGPITPKTKQGYRYAITFLDD